MKILTTNSAGSDRFGGIHTRKVEHVRHSPHHTFEIVELNAEKKYVSRDNFNIHKVNTSRCTDGRSIFEVLEGSDTHEEFDQNIEMLVNEFQNVIQGVNPDAIIIPGTSLTSYFLFNSWLCWKSASC